MVGKESRQSDLAAWALSTNPVDASLIEAQNQPPRKDPPKPAKNADADWTVKNKKSTYGFKLHVGVDEGSGIIRKAEMTPASTHRVMQRSL